MPVIVPDAVKSTSITKPPATTSTTTPTAPAPTPLPTGLFSSPTPTQINSIPVSQVPSSPITSQKSGYIADLIPQELSPQGQAAIEAIESTPEGTRLVSVEPETALIPISSSPTIRREGPSETVFVATYEETTPSGETPLESGMRKYEESQAPNLTPNVYRSGTAVEPITPVALSPEYTQAEKAALQQQFKSETIRDVMRLGLAVTTPLAVVAAPVQAGIGALSSVGIQQGMKAYQGEGLLTPLETLESAGMGATLSVGAGLVGQGVSKVAPVLAERSLVGSLSRVGLNTAISSGIGGGMGGLQAKVSGGDVWEGVRYGATLGAGLGLSVGVAGEVGSYIYPKVVAPRVESLKDYLSPNRVLIRNAGVDLDKAVELGKPSEADFYANLEPINKPQATTQSKGLIAKISESISPERSLYSRVTTAPETTAKTTPIMDLGTHINPSDWAKTALIVKTTTQQIRPMKSFDLHVINPASILSGQAYASLSKVTPRISTKTITVTEPKATATTTKQAPQKTEKKQEQAFGIPEISAFSQQLQNPFTQYQGKPSPIGPKTREATEQEQTVISYPSQSPFPIPAPLTIPGARDNVFSEISPKIDLLPSQIPDISPRLKSIIDQKQGITPFSMVDLSPIQWTSQISETQQIQELTQKQVLQQTTIQQQRFRPYTPQTPRFPLEQRRIKAAKPHGTRKQPYSQYLWEFPTLEPKDFLGKNWGNRPKRRGRR